MIPYHLSVLDPGWYFEERSIHEEMTLNDLDKTEFSKAFKCLEAQYVKESRSMKDLNEFYYRGLN